MRSPHLRFYIRELRRICPVIAFRVAVPPPPRAAGPTSAAAPVVTAHSVAEPLTETGRLSVFIRSQ
jgi:hypothetical protein